MSSFLLYCDPTALQLLRERQIHKNLLLSSSFKNKIQNNIKNIIHICINTGGIITLILTLTIFFVLWRSINIIIQCENPLVVVLSGSMEPAYYRHDLLLLYKNTNIKINDVIVFNLPDRKIPIVHRIHRLYDDGNKKLFLTKGDNNDFDDRTLYPLGYMFVKEEDIVGKVFAIIPYAGFLTNLAENRPWVKVIVLTVAVIWGWLGST